MLTTNTIPSFWKLLTAIVLCEGVGILSGFLTHADMHPWFSSLAKPSWNPPAEIFAPVWTALYMLMGIALWLIWKSEVSQRDKTKAIVIFGMQLLLNFMWSILFFTFRSPALAFVDIVLLLGTILWTINLFSKISYTSSWLQVPYIAWVLFATFLNFSIWSMN